MKFLFPKGKENAIKLTEDSLWHLAVDELIEAIAVQDEDKKYIKEVWSYFPNDYETVRFRQDVIKDLMVDENICQEMSEILKKLDVLNEYNIHNHFTNNKKSTIWDMIDYMEELDIYIQIIEDLNNLFENREVHSEGLKMIKELVNDAVAADKIGVIKEEVASMKTDISTLKSATIGLNLNPSLEPEEMVLLHFSNVPFKTKLDHPDFASSFTLRKPVVYKEKSPIMKQLCVDIERELGKNIKQYKRELNKYVDLKGYGIIEICSDLKYCVLMAKYALKLKDKGYDICFPNCNHDSESVEIKGLYNIRLTERDVKNIVKNDFIISRKEKVFILTGPNRGGKTMLTQGVGIIAFMAAQGLYVTADSYEGYLFDNILTHFPADENQTLNLGRLGEEAVRIKEIAKEATNRSLVLLNETYSSTSAYDGLYLAKDLVHFLKHKEVPTIFNTHIHELARSVDEMNEWDGEGDVVSLTMEIIDNVNTFKVLRREPDHTSFAKNIAMKYGVTYEQMLEG